MKLLLSSEFFEEYPNIRDKFLELIGKPALEAKILMHSTEKKNNQWLDLNKKILESAGIKLGNIRVIAAEEKISYEEVDKYDVIYFCGGDTFYLLDAIRRTGFDEIIKKFVQDPNKLYFGISAGSIIIGPNIEVSGIGDKNEIGLKDLTGLNLIDVAISPHYYKEEENAVKQFQKKVKYKILPLKDGQALLVLNGKQEIIE